MKKSNMVKTIVASLLSISVFSAVLPMKPVQAENIDVFLEDFESYEVGPIIEATSNQSAEARALDNRLGYLLQSGDKLEIAQDETGNKYLKITRGATNATNSHIKYYFPETYSDGEYAISYDFRPDVHNRYFARFGSFIRTDGGINLTTVSYGNNVYANKNTSNSNYYIGNLIKSANYT